MAIFMAGLGLGIVNTAHAATKVAQCKLAVKGKTYIDIKDHCRLEIDPDGSFRIFGDHYFAYLNVLDKTTAEASWNADPKSTHAQAPLGTMTRKAACWANKTAQVCGRFLYTKPASKKVKLD